ncbi:TlpA family protein disulfide reductase [uncultured Jatrophihabitans sp.]|uniref:TlpA family protein disulfide reductase n=1 Tax=uncultured Jatrophihabitans sp. TaxID=1610747 RepID=UPI0035CC2ED9
MKRLHGLLAAALVCLGVLALSACTGGSDAVDTQQQTSYQFTGGNKLGAVTPAAQREPAGPASGTLLDGAKFGLAAAKGKVVVLNFWASWCGPCQTETPQFDLLYRKIKSRGVDFVGIDTKDDKSAAEDFVTTNKISFPIVFDQPGKVALKLGNIPQLALPFTVLIDKQGKVAAVYIVRLADRDLQTALDKLLAER